MRLHRDTNKPDRQLFHDDIDGSKPHCKMRFRTNRCVDPLAPEYILPSYIVAPIVTTKFTRDSFDVSDIEGTKSRSLYPLKQRKNHIVDDIEGAQSGWKPRHLRARLDASPLDHTLNVSDITGGGFHTRRATNPLTPAYRVNGMDIADDPVRSRPRALPKARDSPFYPLTTADIEGAQSGWRPVPQMNPPLEARRHFRNTNFMGDIPGAQADTVKHSICTDRHVNPLNPVYASLDGEPLVNPQTPLYKEPACVEAKAQLDRAIAAEEAAVAVTTSAAMDVSSESNGILPNDKDEVIRRLQHEVQSLRKHVEPWHRGPTSTGDGVPCNSGRITARSWTGSERGGKSCSPNQEQKNFSRIKYAQRLSASSDGARTRVKGPGGSAPRVPLSRTRSFDGIGERERARDSAIGGGAMEIRSRGDQGNMRVERLVLRSANGTPRVSLTPSERRVAREYVDDVSSVRSLF